MLVYMRRLGFSLIELMVVIAIIAVLSSVAVPLYRDYVARANINGTLVPAMNKILDRAKLFADLHGRFPNGQELGIMGNGCSSVTSTLPHNVNAWAGATWPTSMGGPTSDPCGVGDQCGKHFGLTMYLNGSGLGISPEIANVTVLEYHIFKIENEYKTFCFFETGGGWGGPWATKRYITNCFNGNTSGVSQDGGNWQTVMAPIFAAAVCP